MVSGSEPAAGGTTECAGRLKWQPAKCRRPEFP